MAYLEPVEHVQWSFFTKIVNGFKRNYHKLSQKRFIPGAWQGSIYVSDF